MIFIFYLFVKNSEKVNTEPIFSQYFMQFLLRFIKMLNFNVFCIKSLINCKTL